MEESDVETIKTRAPEYYTGVFAWMIRDKCPRCIPREFKEFIRISGMTGVRTPPYYPQSSDKVERWHRSIKSECIRPGTPLSVEDAARLIGAYVQHYNEVRRHSAIGYVTPVDKMCGRDKEVIAERDRKIEEARKPSAGSSCPAA